MLILLSLIWGSSYFLIKISLLTFSSTQVGLGRIALSGIVMLPFFIRFFKKTSKRVWLWCTILGVFSFLIPFMCFAIAQTVINSSLAGMLNSLQPLFTLLLGMLFFKHPAPRYQIIGVLIGFAGAIILLSVNASITSYTDNFVFSLFVVAATLCYGLATNIIRVHLHQIPSLQIASISLGILVLPAIILIWIIDDSFNFHNSEEYLLSFCSLMFLSLIGTSFAVIIYNKLILSAGMMMASSVAYLIPVVAILWGVFSGEKIHITHLIGICVIFIGLYLTNNSKSNKTLD